MASSPKRLYLSESDNVIGGVCGGLADYFNVDATLVRLVFVILALAGGNGFWLYIILWVITPEESDVRMQQELRKRKNEEIEAREDYEAIR